MLFSGTSILGAEDLPEHLFLGGFSGRNRLVDGFLLIE